MNVGLGLALRAKTAAAHRLAKANPHGVTQIADVSISYAFYQTLTRSDQVDIYTLDAAQGDRLHVAINIPQLPGLEKFGVNVLLLGPGLPLLEPSLLPGHAPYATLDVATTQELLLPDSATGYREVFGAADLLRFPGWWLRVRRYFGQWGG